MAAPTEPDGRGGGRLRGVPRPALWLGLAGLLPFVAGALGGWLVPPQAALTLNAMLGYAAVILSFLGGVHWGRALAPDAADTPPGRWLAWSVTPALIAWAAMFLPDFGLALVLFVLAFTAAFFVDMRAVRAGWLPAWYGRLRKVLTVPVLACLLIALLGALDVARL